jgi:hypothetical protein
MRLVYHLFLLSYWVLPALACPSSILGLQFRISNRDFIVGDSQSGADGIR